jgi:hypothetical protein
MTAFLTFFHTFVFMASCAGIWLAYKNHDAMFVAIYGALACGFLATIAVLNGAA